MNEGPMLPCSSEICHGERRATQAVQVGIQETFICTECLATLFVRWNEAELPRAFERDWALMTEQEVTALRLTLTFPEAWALFTHLQVALRVPGVAGYLSSVARRLAMELQAQLSRTPALAEIARRGWMAAEDTEDLE